MTDQVQLGRERPVNLNLFRFHFPIAAVTSITHRMTGILLFLGVWALLYFLHLALQENESEQLTSILGSIWGRGALVLLLACSAFHLLAGVKHLLIDLHVGETLEASRALSWSIWLLTALLTVAVALALWL